jgi:hypothetical protein
MHAPVLNETLVQDPDHRSQQATVALMQADVTRRYQELEHLRLSVLVDLEVRRRVDEESRRMVAANFERALQERVLQANDHLLRSLQHLRVQPPVTSTAFPPTSPSSNITAPSTAPVARPAPKHIQQPCPAWKKSGNCPQGAGCKYQHSSPVPSVSSVESIQSLIYHVEPQNWRSAKRPATSIGSITRYGPTYSPRRAASPG